MSASPTGRKHHAIHVDVLLQLGGYHLLECEDLNEAISIARRIPTIPFGGTVEVRPMEEAVECVSRA